MRAKENVSSMKDWIIRDISSIRGVVDAYNAELNLAHQISLFARFKYKLMFVYRSIVRSSFLDLIGV